MPQKPDPSTSTTAIDAILKARARALLDADADALAQLLHPDFRYVDSLGRELDRAAYLQSRRSGEIEFLRHELSDVRVHELTPGRAAIATCLVDDEGRFHGQRFQTRYRAVHVVVCERDRLLFLFGQSTAIQPEQ